MVTTSYKMNRLKGLEIITEAAFCLAHSDDHEVNKQLLQGMISAAECLVKNEDLMIEYKTRVSELVVKEETQE